MLCKYLCEEEKEEISMTRHDDHVFFAPCIRHIATAKVIKWGEGLSYWSVAMLVGGERI